MKNWFLRLACTAALCGPFAAPLPVLAEETVPFSFQTLRGVKTVAVHVRGVDPDFRSLGFEAVSLQAAIETRLRAAGIEVIDTAQAVARADAALLEVAFTVHDHTGDYFNNYPYAVSVKLKQKIALPGGGGSFVGETVWSDGRSGLEQPSHIARLGDYALALLEHFIADLQAQNI